MFGYVPSAKIIYSGLTMKRLMLLALVMSFAACGDDVKKRSDVNLVNNSANNAVSNNASNNATNTSNNTTNTSNNASNNATNNVSNNATNNVTNNATNNVTNNATNNVTNNATNNTTNNATNNPVPCGAEATFFGSIGSATTTPYSVNANLSAVLAAVPLTSDDLNTVGNEGAFFPAVPIQVNQAMVTAVGFQPTRSFWVQDRNTAVEVFLDVDLASPVIPGQIVSFGASGLLNYEGHPEITSLGGLVVHSSNNPVPYRDVNNRELAMSDYGYVVKVGGELLPNPVLCGGTKTCYGLEHNGHVSTLRSASTFLAPSDCVTYVGPVRSFPGPHGTVGTQTPQLDTINFDWLFERF
jgi:hypothetical protein